MAQALYPDLHRSCHGFMRHKVCVCVCVCWGGGGGGGAIARVAALPACLLARAARTRYHSGRLQHRPS